MKTISFKVSDEEARRIRQLAKRERLSVSEYLRRRAARGAGGPESVKVRRTRCALTGAEIFGSLSDQAPLTTEAVREMLSEFP